MSPGRAGAFVCRFAWLSLGIAFAIGAALLPNTEYGWWTQAVWQPTPRPRPAEGGQLLLRMRVLELGPEPMASTPFVSGRQGATLDAWLSLDPTARPSAATLPQVLATPGP